ncbi:ribosome biogenesis GTP-binding protein YihA/YsxC [Flavobacteriaceae bacterium]|nr:ribosome biogenesis GTP-binding protein YihA/YsxC [Flavobacteriaceae bacterium]
MKIKSANFVISNTLVSKCPAEHIPEYAFIGRSNVGKSSLINMITGNKGLAKTSGKPGKTQLMNHFKINDSWFLVDLPGYGYAQVSKSKRAKFQKFITEYFQRRKQLVCTFVLVDSRHEPQKIDLEFMEFLAEEQVPFCIVYTKSDKLSKNEIQKNQARYKKIMKASGWEEMPMSFMTSATSKQGKEDILNFIDSTNIELAEHFA